MTSGIHSSRASSPNGARILLSGGVPHPTGYPAYVLLLRLFSLVASGGVAARAAVMGLPILALAAIAARAPSTASKVDASTDLRAQEYGLGAVQQAAEGAIILTWQALDAFPLWYHHYALGIRPHVAIIVVPLMQFDWYTEQLHILYPDLALPTREMLALDPSGWASPPEFWKRPVCFPELTTGQAPELQLVCPGASE